MGIGEVFVGREGIIQYGERLPALALEEFVPGQPVHEDGVQLSGAEGVDQLPIGRKTDDFSHVDPVTPEEDLLLRMILDANAFPFQAFGADGHAARKPQIDGTGVVVAVGEIHIRQPLFVFGKPGNDHVQLAPAHFFEQRAESKGLDRAGTAHGLAQRLSDLRVESGLPRRERRRAHNRLPRRCGGFPRLRCGAGTPRTAARGGTQPEERAGVKKKTVS